MIRYLYILILVSFLFSCGKKPDDYNYVIIKIDNYYEENNTFPSSLNEIGINEESLCYYLDENSYNLEFVSGDDLYWYNSGNTVWDFLENDAEDYKCRK